MEGAHHILKVNVEYDKLLWYHIGISVLLLKPMVNTLFKAISIHFYFDKGMRGVLDNGAQGHLGPDIWDPDNWAQDI